jgi:Tol biopolymer transport system component
VTLTPSSPVRPCSGRPARAAFRLAALLLAGRGGSLAAQAVAEVQITPETMTLGVAQRQTLFAAAYDRQGNLIPSARFTYWSSDTLIVRVHRDGTVLGVSPGLAKIEARVQGRRASMAVLISSDTPQKPATAAALPAGSILTIEPVSVALLPGEGFSLAVRALREDGGSVPVGRIAWKSLQPEVATVDSSGIVTGVGPGRTTVQAAAGGLTATIPVEVEAAEFALSRPRLILGPADSDTLRAVVPAQAYREIHGGIQWVSSDTAVVRVGPTGIVAGRGPGQATVTAAGFAQERRATVTVYREPQALVVSPRPSAGPLLVPLRATRQIEAFAEAADSTPIPEARLQWSVGDTALVGFDPAKRVLLGKATGSTTLTVRLSGFEPVVWTVDVIPGIIGLERSRLGLVAGERGGLAATLRDAAGKPMGPATGLEWSSSRPEIARVSGDGVIDGLRPGRATVIARTAWGRSDSAAVFVGSDLLVASNRTGRFGIYQVRAAAGESLIPLLSDSGANVQAALSPDRTRIAFSSDRAGTFDLYVMDADGSHPRRITSRAGSEGEPVWTPDGARIIYTASPGGGLSQLHVVGADGAEDRPLTASPGGNHSPDLSADGRSITFVSARDGSQDIYVMDAAGGEARRITRTGSRESHPHFLPSGELVYVTERGGRSRGSQVMRISPGGTEPTALFETEEPITAFDLSRDGTRAAYVVGSLTDVSRGKGRFGFLVQKLAGGAPEPIPLRPGEQVVSPSF